ncbi:glycoside hydrolase family 43 protein [Timonella senegalensis]|uniref:glycoside hydrolase family 43 protein n=1 Tax=Timonella senegalensis TaxID=1465825 RepID=UPI00031812CE|nr:family 43 glycosylhydrolase [Timonella senegalensis]
MTSNVISRVVPRNPLVEQRADPWILKDGGTYYFTGSYPQFDRIVVRGSSTLAGLSDAEEVTIWNRPLVGEMGGNIWAPELHKINGKWYFYFTAGHADKPFRIRMYVIEGIGEDPRTAVWGEPRRIATKWDEFSLDATVFEHRGDLYYVWAQRPIQEPGLPDGVVINSDMYISKMADPFTLTGPTVLLTRPEADWEIVGFKVNEGPAVVVRNGRVFITFSASATDHHHAMGLLWADENADLLDPASWSKSDVPVFESNDLTKAYGPGHNSFTVDEDGRDIIVFHARSYRDIVGNSLFDFNRHGRVAPYYWNAEGFPVFGFPLGDGPIAYRIVGTNGLLAVTEDSIAPHNRGAHVNDESWEPVIAEPVLEVISEDQATASPQDVSRTLFRVLADNGAELVLEPIVSPGRSINVAREGDLLLGSVLSLS